MTDRIITHEISPYRAWQGPESKAPVMPSAMRHVPTITTGNASDLIGREIIPHDCPISDVATWLLNQASRDYRQHEIDALRAAGAILAALEGGTAFCNDGPQLEALAEEIDMAECRAFSAGYDAALGAAPSGDLISREAAIAAARDRHIHWAALGGACLVDDDISACADIAEAIRALPAQGQPAAPAVKMRPLAEPLKAIADKRHLDNVKTLTIADADRIAEAARILSALEGVE